MTTDQSTFVRVRNPYRPGARLHILFGLLQDGQPYTLYCIADSLSITTADKVSLSRLASALRTIRRQDNGVDVLYDKASKTYRMMEHLV